MTHDQSSRTRRSLLAAAASTAAVGTAGCAEIVTPADIAGATDPGSHVEYFVGVNWLRERFGDVVVLDARQSRFFRAERIYGARRVPLDEFTVQRRGQDGHIPDIEGLADAVGSLGVGPDDDVLVYGSSVGSRVTRTVFVLMALGNAGTVTILNGGLNAWNGRVGTGTAGSPDPVSYDPDPVESTWVDREWLADRVGSFNDDGPGLIDVREPEAYIAAAGAEALDDSHERHGHLPGAKNVHWLGNIAGNSIGDPGELYQLYASAAGLDENETVVVYGDDNVDPTQTWVTLRALGFEDVRLYDGGFGEWANVPEADRGRYPVETGTTAVIETEGDMDTDDGGDFTCN